MHKSPIIEEIIGTWLLKSIFKVSDNGEKTNVYGSNPSGILMYSPEGYMNAQLGFGKRKIMSSGNLMGGTMEEKAEAFDSYVAYYGKYYEQEPGTIIHVVEGCTIPNWVGQKEVRYAQIKNNLLVITTPEADTGEERSYLEVTWEKVSF